MHGSDIDDYHVEEDSDVSDVESVDSICAIGAQDLENQINEYKEKGSLENIHASVSSTSAGISNNADYEGLLYDPDCDEDNEKWIKRKRASHRPKFDVGSVPQNIRVVENASDAMLCCPACMITVCIDCQRHDLYKHQFRAMFVMNCRIVGHELLHYEKRNKSKKRRKKEGPGKLVPLSADVAIQDVQDSELFHPVKCAQCDTEIAVYDKEEVYHFFNVLESLP